MNPDIRFLFEPGSIAVIGATPDRSKIGNAILRNIIDGGYPGRVYPISPRGGTIEGMTAYKTVSDVRDSIDVACIAVPSPRVFEVVRECSEKGVKYGLIVTSGFSEVGNILEEQRIVHQAKKQGMRIVGPNIFGLYSSSVSLNATFSPGKISGGNLGIITQSGALGLAMIGQAAVSKLGLSAIISVGNKSDIDEADLLSYLETHEETRVILLYVEGIKNGDKLVQCIEEIVSTKPVIFIKAGRSKRGAIAAASHTGALAGSDEVFDHVMRQCGAVRAESIREAFVWCKYLVGNPLPRGENVVIITNGGGAGVLATDACEKYGVKLYDDLESLGKTFSSLIPAFGSTKNPVDITGQATVDNYRQAFKAALAHEKIHSVVGLYCETSRFSAEILAEAIEPGYQAYRKAKKPIIFTLLGGVDTMNYGLLAQQKGIPISDDVYEAVSALGAMYKYHRAKERGQYRVADMEIDTKAVKEVLHGARKEHRLALMSHEANDVVKVSGIYVPRSMQAAALQDAIDRAEEIGYPVAMKVVSKDILHKSDVGGVALDLESRQEVIDAYGAILKNCRIRMPQAHIEGVMISEMVLPGTEMIVGARYDSAFGPIVMAGLGGIYVEVLKDVSFRALPLCREEVMDMITELRSYPLLLGVRGEPKRDIDTLVDTIIKLGAIIRKCPEISDIEINPLVVYEQGMGAKAVDVRIILSKIEDEVRS